MSILATVPVGAAATLLRDAPERVPSFLAPGTRDADRSPPSLPLVFAQRGEGGEGGAQVALPQSYALPGATLVYGASKEIAAYASGVHATYAAAAGEAKKLQSAVDAMLAQPSAITLAAARHAWVAARPAYLQTEAVRFYDGPIEEIEGFLNAWPVNEAFIDYVKGAPQSGIVNDPSIEVSLVQLLVRNQVSDEADVTLGWHAIEFLLWGQDMSQSGPGARPASDYDAGAGNNARRRAYLEAAVGRLVADLERLEAAWRSDVPDSYAASFIAMEPREALGRIANGIGVLTGFELMSERMAVALDSGDQEDEHSCFSDTTRQDFVFNLKGVENVWTGRYPGSTGPGFRDLVQRLDPSGAAEIERRLGVATGAIAALPDPWDQVLASPSGSAERARGEAAVRALGDLAQAIKQAATTLGVLVQIPTG
jgi:putative iron-regulated protein